MSAFRALAVAHARSTLNRMLRQMGRAGVWALGAVLVVLAVTWVLPLLGGIGVLGWFAAAHLDAPEAAKWLPYAALFFSALTFLGGFIGGISTGSRQLPWETLRGFPVGPRTLFAAEVAAGLAESITAIELTAMLAACVGATVGAPRAWWLFLALFLTHGLSLLTLQLLAGSLAQRLSKRLRAMLIFLPLLAIGMAASAPMLAERASRARLEYVGERLGEVTGWLPAGLLIDAARSLALGTSTAGALAWAVLVSVAAALGILVVSYQLVARETPMAADEGAGPAARLWSFRSATWGVARLQWESLAQSLPGRFGLLMPLITIVLIRGPLALVLPGRGWTAPIAFFYAALAGTNLLFNQFGLDRHGVKVLLLLPVEARALLEGKLLGFAAWQAVQAGLLLALLVLTGKGQWGELLLGLGLYACVFLVLAMVGQFVSLWQPRPLKKNGLRASQPPLAVVLVMLGTLATSGLLLFGLVFGVRSAAPGWELPAMALTFLLLAALVVPVLAFNALVLVRNRERLIEVLGSSG